MTITTRRDDAAELAARREARLLLARVKAGDRSALPVLADALLLSDAPRDGERLARALHRLDGPLLPRAARVARGAIEAALKRASEGLGHRTESDRREFEENHRDEGRRELQRIDENWRRMSAGARTRFLREQGEVIAADPQIVEERIDWLFEGVFGRDVMLLARDIVDLSPRTNREAQLFRLVLALNAGVGGDGSTRVWRALPSPDVQAAVTRIAERALAAQGAEPRPIPRTRSRRRP